VVIVDLLVLLTKESLNRTPRGGLQFDKLVKRYTVQCTTPKTKTTKLNARLWVKRAQLQGKKLRQGARARSRGSVEKIDESE